MTKEIKNYLTKPAIDGQQGYFRRGARGEGNDRQGPRGHDVGLRSENAGLLSLIRRF
jgi:hypothetical protein